MSNTPKPQADPEKPIIPLDPPPPPPPPGSRTPDADTDPPHGEPTTGPDRPPVKTAGADDYEEISRRFPAEIILDMRGLHITDAAAHYSAHAH